MLSNVRRVGAGRVGRVRLAALLAAGLGWVCGAGTQTLAQAAGPACTTQANLEAGVRTAVAGAALGLAEAVQAGDTAKVQARSVAAIVESFGPTESLVRATAGELGGETLAVTQIYELDARGRKPGDAAEADFACPLSGQTGETDFAIAGLPPGLYAFTMVEASGPRPWLLAFLLEQTGEQAAGGWKLAGFYPRARTAAGHDGLWYWRAARDDRAAGRRWAAWLLYGEADTLLRPADFVSSTNLDKLRSERRAAAPEELSDGLSAQTPLVVKAADGVSYRFTELGSEGAADGGSLVLVMRYTADAPPGPAAQKTMSQKTRNLAAAKALLDAHKELRAAFGGVQVFADMPGQAVAATDATMAEVP